MRERVPIFVPYVPGGQLWQSVTAVLAGRSPYVPLGQDTHPDSVPYLPGTRGQGWVSVRVRDRIGERDGQ